MTFRDWFTRNWASTDEGQDPALGPLELPLAIPDALTHLETVISRLPRWQVKSADAAAGRLLATRRTRLWRFVDEVTIRLEATPHGCRVHADSRSRVGKADFGQNRRNLLQLLKALRKDTKG
jgi:uncharacterized protein (DUF1499 family)